MKYEDLQYSESSMLKNACKNARPKRQLRNFSPVQNWNCPSKRRVDRSLAKTLLTILKAVNKGLLLSCWIIKKNGFVLVIPPPPLGIEAMNCLLSTSALCSGLMGFTTREEGWVMRKVFVNVNLKFWRYLIWNIAVTVLLIHDYPGVPLTISVECIVYDCVLFPSPQNF